MIIRDLLKTYCFRQLFNNQSTRDSKRLNYSVTESNSRSLNDFRRFIQRGLGTAPSHMSATTPTTSDKEAAAVKIFNFSAMVPVVDRRGMFHFNRFEGGAEFASFLLHLLPKGAFTTLTDPYVTVVNGRMETIAAPFVAEFRDDRPAGLVLGFKIVSGSDQVYAWMFAGGCGVFDDSKLVHVKLSDILSVASEPKNDLGEKKWLTLLNSYLSSSEMFKNLEIKSLKDIREHWTLDKSDALGVATHFERVFNNTEAGMRKEAKQYATKGGKVIERIESAYIENHMPHIDRDRDVYDELSSMVCGRVGSRFTTITTEESDSPEDVRKKVLHATRCDVFNMYMCAASACHSIIYRQNLS